MRLLWLLLRLILLRTWLRMMMTMMILLLLLLLMSRITRHCSHGGRCLRRRSRGLR